MLLTRSDTALYQRLLMSGMPGTKVGWPVGDAPALPWFTYKRVKGGEFFADDERYALLQGYDVDLYQREMDDDERDAFEEVLATVGPYRCIESWVPAENCWVTSYSVTLHPNNM